MMKLSASIFFPVAVEALTASESDPFPAPRPVEPQGPIITFESTVFGSESINSGDGVAHAFVVTNRGDEDLEIFRVQPGFGCTESNPVPQRGEAYQPRDATLGQETQNPGVL